jgi:hypothetical protein
MTFARAANANVAAFSEMMTDTPACATDHHHDAIIDAHGAVALR